jgi:hypothetical protein
MTQRMTVTRRELYRLLWTEPTTKVAKTYSISDVGLAKICDKHDIPRPPRGYWARLQHGQKPEQTPLPKPDHDPEIEFVERPAGMANPDDGNPLVDVGSVEIRVAETLRGCHELVSRANEELNNAKVDADGIIVAADGRAIDVRAAKQHVHRALLIFDALLKECVVRGYTVTSGPTITIQSHAIKLGIHEPVDTKTEPDEETDLSKPYEFGHSRVKSTRTPSGRLVLAITDGRGYWASGARHTWRDTEKRRIEECLSKVLITLIEIAEMARRHAEEEKLRAERAREEAVRRAEAEKQRAERYKLYKAEKKRLEHLLQQSDDYCRSRELRELVDAVRRQHETKAPIDPKSEIAVWIDCATLQADRLDPLKVSPPSILDEHFHEEDAKPAPWGGSSYEAPRSYWEQRNWWNRNR